MEKENKTNKKPLVVIFGRTNVGKSTLFNRLTESNRALVSQVSGTTRDSNIHSLEWTGFSFNIVDMAGWEESLLIKIKGEDEDFDKMLKTKIKEQTEYYLKEANLILFVVDSKQGILPTDKELAKFLQKNPKYKEKVLLVANKTDSQKDRLETYQFNKLGVGEPMAVSSVTGSGTGDLLDVVVERLKKVPQTKISEVQEEEEDIKISILGKPNVGKSSLINTILGYNRIIVSDKAHTTREPQDVNVNYQDQQLTLIDTAGINKRYKQTKDKLQQKSIDKSLKMLDRSDIALIVIDIEEGITNQDEKLVGEAIERGKSIIIVANKWDLIEEKDRKKYTQYIRKNIPFALWIPIIFTSCRPSKGKYDKINFEQEKLSDSKINKKITALFDMILKINEQRKLKLTDKQLERLMKKFVKIHRPAKAKGTKKPRIYEIYQAEIDPPEFKVRIGTKDTLHFSYVRFIKNQIREKFEFLGTPLKLKVIK